MRVSDRIVADIEGRHAAKLGWAAYEDFIQALRTVTDPCQTVDEK